MRHRITATAAARSASLLMVLAWTLTACGQGASAQGDAVPADSAADPAPEGYPLTVENCGNDVHFDAPPERVTLLESAPVTILEGIGVFDRVQSRAGFFPLDYYDDELAQRVQDIEAFSDDVDASGHLMISQELVVAQSPDLVLGLPDGLTREGLAEAGAATLTQELYCRDRSEEASFEDLYAEVERFGTIFDRQEAAAELTAELAERVAEVEERTLGEQRTAAILYPTVGGGPVYTYGTSSMAQPQLEAAGFDNVFADSDERVFEVQTEELIDRDPDVLVILYQGQQKDAEDALLQRAGIEGVSALAEERVHYQLFNFTEPASPLVVDGLEQIAEHFSQAE